GAERDARRRARGAVRSPPGARRRDRRRRRTARTYQPPPQRRGSLHRRRRVRYGTRRGRRTRRVPAGQRRLEFDGCIERDGDGALDVVLRLFGELLAVGFTLLRARDEVAVDGTERARAESLPTREREDRRGLHLD